MKVIDYLFSFDAWLKAKTITSVVNVKHTVRMLRRDDIQIQKIKTSCVFFCTCLWLSVFSHHCLSWPLTLMVVISCLSVLCCVAAGRVKLLTAHKTKQQEDLALCDEEK